MRYHLIIAVVLVFTMGAIAQTRKEKKDTLGLFYELQEVKVTGIKEAPHTIDKIEAKEIRAYDKGNLAEVLNLLPGITISRFEMKNESRIRLRGFDTDQTTLFYDGIPFYAPYEGTFDASRFLVDDVAGVSVDKKLLSVKYGPNAIGGAINVVSRKPTKEVDINGQLRVGFADGAGVNSYLGTINAGTLKEKWYAMVSGSVDKVENFVLSKDFDLERTRAKGQKTYVRDDSNQTDTKISAKLGYTPNKTDEYSINFMSTMAKKNLPGSVMTTGRSVAFPIYENGSIYLKTRTLIAPKTFMNFTGYYYRHYDIMGWYDDTSRTLLNNRNSSKSVYNDQSMGAIFNVSTEVLKRNVITLSLTDKYDHHTKYDKEIAANRATGQIFKEGTPEQHYKDNTFFVGLEDVITIAKPLSVVLGGSYTVRSNILARKYGSNPFTGETKSALFELPKGSDSTFNYKAGVLVTPLDNHTISLSAERRTHFASQMARYSSSYGANSTYLPNPDLKSEYVMAYELSYSANINNKLSYEISLFYDDTKDKVYTKKVGTRPDGKDIRQSQNAGNADTKGVELGLGYAPIQYVRLGGSYSFIELKGEDGNGKTIIFSNIPKHKIAAFANFSVPQIRTRLFVNSESYLEQKDYDEEDMPDFTVVNAKLSYDMIKELTLSFSVKNALDKNYYFSSENFPSPGRSFLVALEYRF
ncbi:iron complex outermembrane recepter protein [Capnocytophaga haemolytica]|uniref:Colicin I receptor n=2 Tax=Capnocytophaga haemolytica TaxID=45243 RepID=A0AAX2GWY5_9FLAO|nr:TonB-dependent receptor [Capnocytophaga haemolytica]SFN73004.1 iron complex outermembrane recepter protein [Capnocytophaga haemolytica]SNV07872.1 Colicin I receptor precursor [Capnocytophaga haemolytica]